MKKVWKVVALAMALSMVAALSACGGNSETSTSAAPSGSTAPSTSTAAPSDEKLSVALLLPGSLNDGGWNANAYAGLKDLEAEGYTVAFTENIAIAAIEEAMRNYASEGYDLVIGHGAEFGEPAMRVAPEFPDVNFFVSGKMPDGVF